MQAALLAWPDVRLQPTDALETTIGLPREEVFEYLSDIANHAEFSDHYLVDWHLLREDSQRAYAGYAEMLNEDPAGNPADPTRSAATRYRSRAYSHVVALQGAGNFHADHDRRIGD